MSAVAVTNLSFCSDSSIAGLKSDPLTVLVNLFFLFFFGFSLTSLSRLFHSYRDEPIVRWGEAGVPRVNHLTHPDRTWLVSHVASAGLEPTQLKFSDLTHSAMGAACSFIDKA